MTKLIIAGATGFVAKEVIRQSLQNPSITSVVALARRPVPVPEKLDPGADTTKLKSVVLEDFSTYPDEVKKELAGANACVWTMAITPTKSKGMDFQEVRRVCHDFAMTGLETIYEARDQSEAARPFRFLYISGSAAERDQTKKPAMMAEYCLMRGEVENQVLAFAAERKGKIEATVVKPGLINEPGVSARRVLSTVASAAGVFPSILVTEFSAAMLDEILNGFTKEPLTNNDLVEIGRKALSQQK